MDAERLDGISPRHETPLVVRASLPRTFLSMGLFVEVGLLCCGTYLLIQMVRRPLETDNTAIIGAGVLLALATVLLFYLVRPKTREALASREQRYQEEFRMESTLTAYGEALETRRKAEEAMAKEDLPGPM